MSDYVLEMNEISKSYFGNTVLNNVSLKIKPGEVHALMGENGAGKSTLMNILFGMPVIHSTGGFDGTIKISGEEVTIDSPQKAMMSGIGMVHQEFMLIPGFTIAENIKLGREITRPNIASMFFGKNLETLSMKKMRKDARLALDTIGMNIKETDIVRGLPVGHMQFIEIAREIDKENIKILVFDEPTAVLTETEAERLLEAMKTITDKGIAIIFITHRLQEVMNSADNMTVLRDGELIAQRKISETSTIEIAELMVGRKIEKLSSDHEDNRELDDSDIALSLKNFSVNMPGERVKSINLDVRKGEILGIGGLAGQGKLGILNGITGLYETSGSAELFGQAINFNKYGDALAKGMAFVSEDRRSTGLIIEESIEYNIVFKAMQVKNEFLKNYGITKLVDQKKATEHSKEMVDILDIRAVDTGQKVGSLSGGNQQKVCLASAITLNPKFLIVSEPTRGIDIGAKNLVLDYLVKLNRDQGLTIIIVSSELQELLAISDRVAIITEGEITAILPPNAKEADFGLAMSGHKIGGSTDA